MQKKCIKIMLSTVKIVKTESILCFTKRNKDSILWIQSLCQPLVCNCAARGILRIKLSFKSFGLISNSCVMFFLLVQVTKDSSRSILLQQVWLFEIAYLRVWESLADYLEDSSIKKFIFWVLVELFSQKYRLGQKIFR